MAKEILLYSSIFSFTAERFIEEMEAAKSENVVLRVNTNGGDPEAAFGMIAKFQEHLKNTLVKVDGKAHSSGAFFVAASNEAEALNVSTFIIHRAAFSGFLENDPERFTQAFKDEINRINAHLRAILEAKVDVPKFEQITGVTMDQIFSLNGRVTVRLDAKQALEVGLIDRIVSITPEVKAEINSNMLRIAAEANGFDTVEAVETPAPAPKPVEKIDKNKNKNMTIETIKAEHAALYAQIKAEGHAEGVTAGVKIEGDRIGSWLAYNKVDAKAVEAGIKSGEAITATAQAEFAVKMQSPDYLKALAKDSAEAVKTDKAPLANPNDKEDEAVTAFEAELNGDDKTKNKPEIK